MNKAVTFERLVVVRKGDRSVSWRVPSNLPPVPVATLMEGGCGVVFYTHKPGDLTVSGFPVYRDW